ncbi:unnamed protein product [Tetraodon nigroviridis]|uniref:(spotted green pufferfish) hypothetical protein n=1 Tax=Tetraodon nigroviridis TaxID=99883 RepID=Q4SQV7_TETNG|nr:unnamed protein product [Tetraodon nigroviridis]
MPNSSPLSISRHSSMSNVSEIRDISEMSLFRKPSAIPRVPLFSAGQTGQMGSSLLRLSSQDSLASHGGPSASTSAFPGSAEASYSQTSRWQTPIFKPPSALRNSTSSLF